MRVGMFGGTFNPPHIAHRRLAETAVLAGGLDLLYIIPAATPPHKRMEGNDYVSPSDRFEMAKIAFSGMTATVVSDIELKREGPSYSSDTIRELADAHPGARLVLLMGDDMFRIIEKWHEFEFILKNVEILIFLRNSDDRSEIMEYIDYVNRTYGADVGLIDAPVYPHSSTLVRGGADGLIDPAVAAYIEFRGLYGGGYDLSSLRELMRQRLSEGRYMHSISVEQEAAKLASRYGASIEKARVAGILHDAMKDVSTSEQAEFMRDHGEDPGDTGGGRKKLLHAPAGAIFAEHFAGVKDPEILDAIRYHTTGRGDMTLLDKVIFLADYIEPLRDFEGVEAVREAAYDDIDRAMTIAIRQTADEVREKGYRLDPDTLNLLAELTGEIDSGCA